jgi:hypothetical protein
MISTTVLPVQCNDIDTHGEFGYITVDDKELAHG